MTGKPERVLVLGGGVGGMTAAHELAERGFQVTVLDARDIPGGKARSMPATGTGTPASPGGPNRPDLPAEHGFRFFPGFYVHVPDTMRRIPFESNPGGVFDNLRLSTRAQTARIGAPPLVMPARFPRSLADLRLIVHDMRHSNLGIPARDLVHFARCLFRLLSSCEERRYAQWEHQSWWKFSEADQRSEAFQKYLAIGLTRTLVAAQADRISARTGGYILLQLLLDMMRPGRSVDRVLDGPTNDRWIDPWLTHLRSLGVDYRSNATVTAINTALGSDGQGRITGVDATEPDGAKQWDADWYVAAMPVEEFAPLVTKEMKEAEPLLGGLGKLETRWMNGVMYYLATDVPLVRGHSIYIDSPWALTSISQEQFWEGVDLTTMGNGTVHGILSVDVSDWTTPGLGTTKKAMECTKQEVIDEVWLQLKAHLNVDGVVVLRDEDVVTSFVDTDITFVNPHPTVNLEPLLINTAGSWDLRPVANTAIVNFFLASDYVRTYTDLATMEGANEAARRAVNGILDLSGSSAPRCQVWPLREPKVFAPLRALDRWLFRRSAGRHADAGDLGPGPG
jgi:uncharacterized protein with NAD-binding domain and iron-sulfur cluster